VDPRESLYEKNSQPPPGIETRSFDRPARYTDRAIAAPKFGGKDRKYIISLLITSFVVQLQSYLHIDNVTSYY
jgi:hypothetical protein